MPTAKLSNGIELAYEIHGDRDHPVVFPILGITDNITDWPPGLYAPLVEDGFCVVRHELRDSGFSTKFDDFGPADLAAAQASLQAGTLPDSPYTLHEVAEDCHLLMAHLGIDRACIVGYSYGGAVAQLLALRAPARIAGLMCLQGSNYDPSLPPRQPSVNAAMTNATRECATTEQAIETIAALRLAANGSIHRMDEAEARQCAETSVGRMYCPNGTGRMLLSRMATPAFADQTSAIECPALVLHADEDPIFSVEHGEDIARRLPNASLRVLEGVGHNHPVSLQPTIASAIRDFADETLRER